MALTKASYSMVTGAPANVLDFGAVGDGLTDSTVAIQNAINSVATAGGAVYFPPGEYLISTSLTVSTYGVSLIGASGAALWNGVSTINDGGAIIIKSAAMAADAIVVTGGKFVMQDIALIGQIGNTGDGVYIKDAQSCVLSNVCVARMGGNGIRIGMKPGADGNTNGWQLLNVTSQSNGSHGVLIYDQSTNVGINGPNANAGTATGLQLADNGADGLRIENGQFNTFNGILSQQNTGYGVSLIGSASVSLYATFNGGDVEANIAGNWNVSANAKHLVFSGAFPNLPTINADFNFAALISGSLCRVRQLGFAGSALIDRYDHATYTPYLSGSSLAGFNTYANVYSYSTQLGRQVTVQGVLELTAKGTGGNTMTGELQVYFGGNFAPLSLNQTQAKFVWSITPSGGLNLGAGFSTNIVGVMLPNTRYFTLYKVSTTDGSLTAMTPADITDSFAVFLSGTYLSNA